MSFTIHKYQLEPSHAVQEVKLPARAEILSVIEQNGTIQMYCKVDPSQKGFWPTQYLVVGTGWEIDSVDPNSIEFVATVKCGEFVWHVFTTSDLPF